MASSLSLLLSFFLLFSLSSSQPQPQPQPQPNDTIRQACLATRVPDACQSMLGAQPGPPPPDPVALIQLAFNVSTQNLKTGRVMVQQILDSSTHNPNRSLAAQNCLDDLGNSEKRSLAAGDALARGKPRDARALASAALSYQYGCWSGLKYVNDTPGVNETMSFFDTTLIVSTSNALSMMRAFDVFGPNLGSWAPPKTERDGFWEPVNSTGSVQDRSMSLAGLAVDATVCKGGGSECKATVQAAVDAAPENLEGEKRFVIKIKEGVYDEIVRVGLNKKNLVFLGDGMGKTVITGSLNHGLQGINTYHTATVGVLGDGFMASGLTIQNTAPAKSGQAVAFRSDSDFSYIENCEFLGNQDTLYVHSLRQLYKSCHIEGNVDFIFGNAAAVFQNCTILIRQRQIQSEQTNKNAITAHGRTDPAQTTGLAFLGCLINGTAEYLAEAKQRNKPDMHLNFLGRPWKLYSKTVFINCTMGDLINPQGWLPWTGDDGLSTLYYGEYGNSGPGADVSKRVNWSSQIPPEHVPTFYVQNFLQGDEWITKIPS